MGDAFEINEIQRITLLLKNRYKGGVNQKFKDFCEQHKEDYNSDLSDQFISAAKQCFSLTDEKFIIAEDGVIEIIKPYNWSVIGFGGGKVYEFYGCKVFPLKNNNTFNESAYNGEGGFDCVAGNTVYDLIQGLTRWDKNIR